MKFMVKLKPFSFALERRYSIAQCDDGRAVGFLVAVSVFGRQGWFWGWLTVLRAFGGGGRWGFGLDTGRRLLCAVKYEWWSSAQWGFAVLLILWTLLLALLGGEYWLGDRGIRVVRFVWSSLGRA